MAKQLFANNAKTSMSGSLAVGGTTFVCASGEGAKFPTPTGGDYFLMTLFELDVGGNETKLEVVKVTTRTGDSFTIVRDVESMTGNAGGYAYAGGASVCYAQMRVTAKTMTDMAQNADADFTGPVTMSDDLTVSGNIYGSALLGKDASTTVTIRPSTADGSDNQFAVISGGGASANAARGAYAVFYGNEHANAGSLSISSGSAADLRLGIGGGAILTLMGATGFLKHAYSGAAGSPVYCLANTTDTGLYGGTNNVGIAASGVQAARFYDGYSVLGGGAASTNVFSYLYGTSPNTTSSSYGQYNRITWNVTATANTDIRANQTVTTLTDDGSPRAVANYRCFWAATHDITAMNAGSTITTLTQFDANGHSDTRIATLYGYRSGVAKVTGTARWNFYAAGDAPSYFYDTHIAGNRFDQQPSLPATITASATLSTASMLGRIVPVSGLSANVTLTLPTGTVMDGAVDMPNSNFAFDWTVINTNGTYTATVAAAASGHTVVGNMTVAVNTSAMFRTRKTATNNFITYRVG